MLECRIYENIGETLYFEKLKNGLQIFIIKKEGFQSKYAVFGTNYGGINLKFKYLGESIDTVEGIAHFLEHKMFDMPEGDNAMNILTSNGANPNAFTSSNTTCYYFDCTEHFSENLHTLLRFVSTPYFTEETVDKEKGIISQEILMGEDNPGIALYYNFLKLIYGEHPMSHRIAGTCESIRNIDPATLYKCHAAFYNPTNMVLCVEGDVDPKEVIRIAEQVLPSEASPAAENNPIEDSFEIAEKLVSKTMPVSAPQFFIGSKFKPFPNGEELLRQKLIARLAVRTLAGSASPFFTANYESGLLCYDFGGETNFVSNLAFWMIGGESREPEKVFELFKKEVSRVIDNGIDKDLFELNKRALLGSELRSLEDFEDVCLSIADGAFSSYDHMQVMPILHSITAADCLVFIKEAMQPEKMVMSIVVPPASDASAD